MHRKLFLLFCGCCEARHRAFQGYNYPEIHDQLDVGDTYRFYCPPGCAEDAINLSEVVVGNDTESEAGVIGDEYYADVSRICASAAHAGVIGDSGVRGSFLVYFVAVVG
jgi:hypothetical protein